MAFQSLSHTYKTIITVSTAETQSLIKYLKGRIKKKWKVLRDEQKKTS